MGVDKETIKQKTKTFVAENYILTSNDAISDDDSFLETGIIDSTGVLELVAFLETTFDMKVENEELTTENLDSINKVVDFVCVKTAAKVEAVAAKGDA